MYTCTLLIIGKQNLVPYSDKFDAAVVSFSSKKTPQDQLLQEGPLLYPYMKGEMS